MPFTPYHFGPGILLSAVSRNNVDWAAYCLANVLIDLEPLYYMAVEERPLHRTMHTFVMATVAVVGAYLLMVLAGRIWQRVFKNASPPFALPRGQLIAGAVLGGYSHIFLDAVLYREMKPFWPVTAANPMLGLWPGAKMEDQLIAAMGFGLFIWILHGLVKGFWTLWDRRKGA